MIETSQEHRRERFEAAKAERLDNYMDDVVQKLEKLQKEEDGEDGVKYVKRKQKLWEAQYIRHRHNLTRTKEPSVDERATQQEIEDIEADARKKDAILENWSTPPGSP